VCRRAALIPGGDARVPIAEKRCTCKVLQTPNLCFLAPHVTSCNRIEALYRSLLVFRIALCHKDGEQAHMSADTELSDLELAALVSSRICHDIISPVGAIANGLEVMAEEADQSMREHAMDLIRKSAHQASAKLQFARLAFGAAGSSGAEIDLMEAEKVARAVAESDKHTVEWNGPPARLEKDKVKLLLNMITVALNALPRGGVIKISVGDDPLASSFEIRCQGEKARVPEVVEQMLAGSNGHALDAHSIQPYYALLIAKAAGMSLSARMDEDDVVLLATEKN